MQQAFPEAKLAPQEGTDILNPRFSSMTETISILVCTALVLLVFLIWSYKSSKFVAEGNVLVEPNKDSTVVTEPFELTKSRQILSVETESNVQNAWMYTGVNLINTETGEEQFSENEISYYSGIEGGESWSEGSRSNDVKFCDVKAGKYVLAFNLFKPGDDKNKGITYELVNNGTTIDTVITFDPSYMGDFRYKIEDGGVPFYAFVVALVALALFALFVWYLEQKRWEFSVRNQHSSSEEEED